MIVEFGALDRQRVLEAAARLETELFGSEAWNLDTLRCEMADPSRIYLADITDSANPTDFTDAADPGGSGQDTAARRKSPRPSPSYPLMRGYAGMWHADGQAEIMTIGVAKRFQRQGIAGNLLDGLIDYARSCKVRRIKLEVRVDNEPAKRLYHNRGFNDIGLLRHYYQPEDIDAVEMALDLETHIMGFGSVKQNMEQMQ
ncbi:MULTISPECIES: GNAT family N-acetyltransferase [unclassified Bifidobacterium]|uniref:GNAT family N-acetyltransferase n=1 Tax=unclassified Bifidobacterium TaxID=2608897 RepID=UPI0023F9CE11|nr:MULTISPECIES: GNAT family N-acetyltransferase [unclassified Bifidobacterium]WEV66519.1 GNAT family N-acetyltransferase [Bifidobacterium sp. ESL0764]WEV76203.1 GNAT family N-acetyltransferase [Bifidobacterium sp. ESL0800]